MKFKRILLVDWIDKLKVGDRLRGFLRRCSNCEKKFVSVRGDTKYCSGGCAQKAYRERVEK